MTQEERDLLLKDLCARLPYGVVCKFFYTENKKSDYGVSFLEAEVSFENIEWFLSHKDDFVDMKPYLRPMSSMIEKERNEWMEITHAQEWLIIGNLDKATDWLNKNGFDYRGLIPMGLALEAKEVMYKEDFRYERN